MTGDSRELVKSAVVLREQASQQWDIFVRSMLLFASTVAQDMVKAEPDSLPRAQGMALMASEIAQILLKAPELFDKARAAEYEKRAKPPMRKPDARTPWTS